MVEALVLATIVVAFALAIAGFSFFGWLFVLPFRIVGMALKLVLALIALPLMLVFGVVAVGFLGVGALVLALPMMFVLALPLLLFAWATGKLTRRNRKDGNLAA